MKYQRWTSVQPTSKEEDILENRGSGYASRNGKDICLLTQTNDDVVWGIAHRSGEIVTVDLRGDDIEKAELLAKKYDVDVMSNDIGDYSSFELGYDKAKNNRFLQALHRI